MAQIKEYNLQTNAAGPERQTAAHVEDTGNTGTALTQLGRTVGNIGEAVEKRQGQINSADISAKMSKAHADSTIELNEMLQKATPEDLAGGTSSGAPGSKSLSDKFLDNYDKRMAEIADGATTDAGREYFEKSNAQLRAHFQVQAYEGQAALIGAKAKTDTINSIQNGSTVLMNDPSALEITKKNFDEFLQAQIKTGGLPAAKAGELQKAAYAEFAEGSARGYMNINPDAAEKMIKAGKFDAYISGDQKYKLLAEAKVYKNAQEVEENRQKKMAKDARKEQAEATQDMMLNKIYKNEMSSKEILNDHSLDFSEKLQMIHVMKQHQEEANKTDPEVYRAVYDRVNAKDGDPQKITDVNELSEFVGNGISVSDLQSFRKQVQGGKSGEGKIETQLRKSFTDMAKNQLTKTNEMTGLKDPNGDEQYHAFLTDFTNKYQSEVQKGKTPDQLLNPKSPDYMGNMLQNYVKTPNQIMQDMAAQVRNVPAPSAPKKESPWSIFTKEFGAGISQLKEDIKGITPDAPDFGFPQKQKTYEEVHGKQKVSAKEAPKLNKVDQEAIAWAQSNRDDPRSSEILKLHGMK